MYMNTHVYTYVEKEIDFVYKWRHRDRLRQTVLQYAD